MVSDDSDYADFVSDGEEVSNPLLITSQKSGRILNHRLLDNGEEKELHLAIDEADNEEADKEDENGGSTVAVEGFGSRDLDDINNKAVRKTPLKNKKTINATKKLKHKTGVVYFSTIPPYMKPAKMRQILSKFGDVDRLFLKREDEQKRKQRTRGGGNKKAMYEEGWAEFIRKRDAKICAETLNGNIIGGKKGSFYHDDILNVKYLPGFKWTDLTEQIARENDIRQSKLEKEISLANKLNAEYAKNVEMSKTITNMKKTKKRSNEDANGIHRSFKQHKVSTTRADAPQDIKDNSSSNELTSVLNNLL